MRGEKRHEPLGAPKWATSWGVCARRQHWAAPVLHWENSQPQPDKRRWKQIPCAGCQLRESPLCLLRTDWNVRLLEAEHRGRRHSRDNANRTDTEQRGTDRVVLRPQPQPSCIFTAVRRKVCPLTPTASGLSHCSHHHPLVNEWTHALVPCQTLTFLSRRYANTEYQQSLWPFFFISLSFLRFFKELSTSDFPSVLKADSLTCLRALYHTTVLQIPKWKVNPNCVHLYCTQTRTQWPVVAPEKRGLVPRICKIAYCAKFVAHLPMLMWDNWPHVLQKCIAFPQPSD